MRFARTPMGPLLLAALLAMTVIGPAAAAPGEPIEPDRPAPWEDQPLPDGDEVVEDAWFVELAAPPRASGGGPATHANERAQLRAQARAEGVEIDQRRDFTTLYNGLTVNADAADAATLRRLDNVAAMHPVAVIEAPDPGDVDPQLSTALAMTGADTARSELGLGGEGLSVAVIDTGIDYNHPDLGGDGDAGARLEADDHRRLDHPRITHGHDYVGDDFDPSDPDAPQDPAPNPDPMDVVGHGTHVAGIVGASAADDAGVTGVAPEVTLGAYKVFGAGSTSSEVIVAALEDAYDDGMDIVNMSLGAAFAWGQDYPTTRASNELSDRGVTVVNSAGNSGADGAWALSAPANAHDVISVASADNTELEANAFDVDQLDEAVPYLELTGAQLPPTEGVSEELVHLGRACTDSEGDELQGDPAGAVALIARGVCPFEEKYVAAAEAGAAGVVIYNNVAGPFAGTVGDGGVEGVWGAGISDADGTALVGLLDDGEEVVLDFTDRRLSVPSPTGGLVSAFSSYGMDVELEMGPSVMAPGGLITSTYPLALDGYATLSGTSMSAPHVAGAVALLREAEPDLDPVEIRDRLQNTAQPADWSLSPDAGLDHTFRQGAGMIQVDEAILAEQRVAPGQLSLGDAPETTTTVTLANAADQPVTYEVGHAATVEAAGSTFTPAFYLAGAQLEAPAQVEVPAGGTTDLEVTLTAPGAGLANHQYGGYLVLTPEEGDATTLRVPYSGFDGDYVDEMGLLGYWQDPETFVDVEPQLTELLDGDGDPELGPVAPGHTFVPRLGDLPVVEVFLGHYARRLELWAVDQRNGHRRLAFEDEHVGRSPWVGETQPIPWDGRVPAGRSGNRRPAPPGTYTLELRVLRALGDEDDPGHWETWESPPFELDSRGGGPGRGPGS